VLRTRSYLPKRLLHLRLKLGRKARLWRKRPHWNCSQGTHITGTETRGTSNRGDVCRGVCALLTAMEPGSVELRSRDLNFDHFLLGFVRGETKAGWSDVKRPLCTPCRRGRCQISCQSCGGRVRFNASVTAPSLHWTK